MGDLAYIDVPSVLTEIKSFVRSPDNTIFVEYDLSSRLVKFLDDNNINYHTEVSNTTMYSGFISNVLIGILGTDGILKYCSYAFDKNSIVSLSPFSKDYETISKALREIDPNPNVFSLKNRYTYVLNMTETELCYIKLLSADERTIVEKIS